MVIAIVRVRGPIDVRPETRKTMELLRLTKRNHCVLLSEEKHKESLKGMLNRCKDYVTWGKVPAETVKMVVEKRGRLAGDKKPTKEDIAAAVKAIETGEKSNVKPVYRLHPPRKGWKSTKYLYPRGALGPRGEKMAELLKKMV